MMMDTQVQVGSTLAFPRQRAARNLAPRAAYSRRKRCFTLTPRLEELAALLAKGYSYKQCAMEMRIAAPSINAMASDIYYRLGGLTGQAELAAWWRAREFQRWLARHKIAIPSEAMQELSAIFGLRFTEGWLD